MISAALKDLEQKYKTPTEDSSTVQLVALARSAYEQIDNALHLLASDEFGDEETEIRLSRQLKIPSGLSVDEYERELLDTKDRIVAMVNDLPCKAAEDFTAKIKLLKLAAQTESCFEEHPAIGDLFTSVCNDSAALE